MLEQYWTVRIWIIEQYRYSGQRDKAQRQLILWRYHILNTGTERVKRYFIHFYVYYPTKTAKYCPCLFTNGAKFLYAWTFSYNFENILCSLFCKFSCSGLLFLPGFKKRILSGSSQFDFMFFLYVCYAYVPPIMNWCLCLFFCLAGHFQRWSHYYYYRNCLFVFFLKKVGFCFLPKN